MDFLKRRLLRESLHHLAATLDSQDLAFVGEVVNDPRFARLMTNVQNGKIIHEEISEALAGKA
ncbi:MAG: hypothetical protein AB1921_11305 [Thermodesulfobacteriota bacterium]